MDYSLYFHVPFCKRRCHYCDFYTTIGNEALIPAYVDALIKEFRIVTKGRQKFPVHSIYFGGGTPSLIPADQYEKLLGALYTAFCINPSCEISLEANPGTLSRNYLRRLHELGFNRLSIGVQSTDSFDLMRLDRRHDIEDVLSSLYHARVAGFKNISLDLIFGLPWQDLRRWQNSLERAIQLSPEHLSIYSLIIEPGTPLHHWYQRGWVAEKDQDLEGEMFEWTMTALKDAGYEHYEISNWHKQTPGKDFRCLHNLQYWRNQPYFGFGPSAHGYVESVRTVNVSNLGNFINIFKEGEHKDLVFPGGPATILMEPVNRSTQMKDFMMLGLRLIGEGVSEQRFQKSFNNPMGQVFRNEIAYLLAFDLVEWVAADQGRLRLTPRGVMVANQVFMQFI